MPIEKIKIPIVPEIMRIDTRTQAIDMQQIDNRRFMYNPDTGLLVLGRQYAVTSLMDSSHAGELAAAGMEGKEGLILQGCGGDLKEWVDGINEMFTDTGILKEGSKFEDVSAFQYGELTCLLYPFEDVKLDIGKLAVWRLQTHADFGGTWLSDFVPNRLGGFIGEPSPEPEKSDCALIGQDGNVFNLTGIASRTLRRNGMAEQAKEMSDRVFASGSYHEALNIIGEYVNITDSEAEPERRASVRRQMKEAKTAEPAKKQKTPKQQER